MASHPEDNKWYVFLNCEGRTAMNLAKGSDADGTGVQGHRFNFLTGHPDSVWKLEKEDNTEYYRIRNRTSGTYLDLSHGASTNGTKIQGLKFTSNDEKKKSQLWKFKEATTEDPTRVKVWYIVNQASGTVASLMYGDSKDGTFIGGYQEKTDLNYMWILLPTYA